MENSFANSILRMLSRTYGRIADLRNIMFDRRVFKPYLASVPVISVGNVSMGGSGKTPFTDFLTRELVFLGRATCILSRGYGRKSGGYLRVNPMTPNAGVMYGEEPLWLALKNPASPVIVCEDRVYAVKKIESEYRPQAIVLDDGFQHRWLHRNLDIVLVDATSDLETFELMPQGCLRESASALQRAHLVVLTKTNLASNDQVLEVKSWIQKNIELRQIPVLEWEYRLQSIRGIQGGDFSLNKFKGCRALLVSALGNPHSFEKVVEKSVGAKIAGHLKFRDHHSYTSRDVEQIRREFSSLQADVMFFSEKDEVSLRSFASNLDSGYVLCMQGRFRGEADHFYEALRSLP